MAICMGESNQLWNHWILKEGYFSLGRSCTRATMAALAWPRWVRSQSLCWRATLWLDRDDDIWLGCYGSESHQTLAILGIFWYHPKFCPAIMLENRLSASSQLLTILTSTFCGVTTKTRDSPTQKTEFGDLVVFNPEPHQSFPSGQTFVSYRMDFTELRLPPFLCSQVQLNKAIQEQRLAKYLKV